MKKYTSNIYYEKCQTTEVDMTFRDRHIYILGLKKTQFEKL